ncbi:MAG TPA: penicillin-binding transpeptidase domain-containing protein [Thermoanaerobaculia bacterium]|nr:penicillin-binding transpeptidase domain-containing protein [Thermoanaerobaculia bacterium]
MAALLVAGRSLGAQGGAPSGPPAACAAALREGTVCAAANAEAGRWLAARRLAGAVVVQDVRSGALIAFASSPPPAAAPAAPGAGVDVDVNTPVLPLSIAKLWLAASWWDHEARIRSLSRTAPISVHEMLVSGSDSAGKQLAVELRHAMGDRAVFADLGRFGLRRCPDDRPPAPDDRFWSALAPRWRLRLLPADACVSMRPEWTDGQWATALSIGETGFAVTLLHLSRFLQAIGNDGVMVPPVARAVASEPALSPSGRRMVGTSVVGAGTARKLQDAMIDTVLRGTATGIRGRLGGEWLVGGKTGTGPGDVEPWDGCFAGLVFDPKRVARYTVVSYVRRGGRGGGAAAELAADLVGSTLIPATPGAR